MTLPTNRVLNYVYDDLSRTTAVNTTTSAGTQPVASSFSYAPYGAVTQMTMGNNLVEQRSYNPRWQVTSLGVGSLLILGYDYGSGSGVNNGNMLSQTIGNLGASQSYGYDGLNRLRMAVEGGTALPSGGCPSGVTWCEQYGYDRFGNRNVNSYAGLAEPVVTPNPTTTFPNNQISTASYDAAGNQTGALGMPGTLSYDAENRQVNVTLNAAFLGISESYTYAYDGDGQRVSRSLSALGMTSTYVYDAGGTLAAEYRNGNLWKEFLYGAGRLLMVQDAVQGASFLSVDALGSTRLVTNASGNVVISRHDYLPFGKEVPVALGGRNAVAGYANPQASVQPADERVLQRFTGQEEDPETGLQYFQARYYSGAQGRFMSPDPLGIFAANPGNPQSWNQYSYVLNNPLIFTDPTGTDCVYLDDEGSGVEEIDHNSSQAECNSAESGGYWVNGYVGNGSWVTIDYENNLISSLSVLSNGAWGISVASQNTTWGAWELGQQASFGSDYLSMGLGEPTAGPANNGNQNNTGSERLERLKNCALGYYGIDPLSVAGLASSSKWALIAAGAGGVPKVVPDALGMRVIMLPGSSRFTSLLSMISVASGGGTLRAVANFGSKWAGPIAIASAVIDATAIGVCTASN